MCARRRDETEPVEESGRRTHTLGPVAVRVPVRPRVRIKRIGVEPHIERRDLMHEVPRSPDVEVLILVLRRREHSVAGDHQHQCRGRKNRRHSAQAAGSDKRNRLHPARLLAEPDRGAVTELRPSSRRPRSVRRRWIRRNPRRLPPRVTANRDAFDRPAGSSSGPGAAGLGKLSANAFTVVAKRAGASATMPQPYGRPRLDIRPERVLRPAATIGCTTRRPDPTPTRGLRRFAIVSVSPQPPIDLQAAPVRSDVGGALRRVGAVVGLGVLPIVAIVTMFVVGWREARSRATSTTSSIPRRSSSSAARTRFRRPTPRSAARTSSGHRSRRILVVAAHRPPARRRGRRHGRDRARVLRARPLARRRARLARVRRGRRSGRSSPGEMRVSHLTPVIAVLLAAAWRWRDARGAPGRCSSALAVAVKFFVWPLAVWLAATRRWREQPSPRCVIAGASLLLVLPFTSLRDYAHALSRSARSSTTRATTSSDCSSRQARATASLARRPSWSASLSLPASGDTRASRSRSEPRSCSPRSPGSTTTRSPRCRSPSCGPAVAAIWFLPLADVGARGRRDGYRRRAVDRRACCSSSQSCSESPSGPSGAAGRATPAIA